MGWVDRGETTAEAVMEEQERLLGESRAECTLALFEGTEIRAGLLRELALYSAGGTGGNGAMLQSCVRPASRRVAAHRRSRTPLEHRRSARGGVVFVLKLVGDRGRVGARPSAQMPRRWSE
jgi:hypothetical protein